ncbi:MAG: RES superfamily protein [Bacteroidetes bacterium GWA2_30_7]|nr:MAG: RES superfamily protein [Bacteroidetes bacterium GWA2_30_7]
MIVFRLCKKKHSSDLTGKGAEKSGGRWNSKGTAMIYTCESRALCTAEIAVHSPLGIVPADYVIITIKIPDNIEIFELDIKNLKEDWKLFPHSHSTQLIGDKFISENKYFVMKVPSVVVQGDFNYLINPFHDDFKLLKILNINDFEFDSRLFKR